MSNMCTKFGADWKIIRYRNDDTTETVTEIQIHRMTDMQVIGHFVVREV